MTRSLTLDDIADLPTYEREREAFRDHVIALKRRRRVAVGPLVTLLFENRDTIRFQIQEMARVERLATDAAIESELDAYNPLIPEPGGLSATLFIELTADELLREWPTRIARRAVPPYDPTYGFLVVSLACVLIALYSLGHLLFD